MLGWFGSACLCTRFGRAGCQRPPTLPPVGATSRRTTIRDRASASARRLAQTRLALRARRECQKTVGVSSDAAVQRARLLWNFVDAAHLARARVGWAGLGPGGATGSPISFKTKCSFAIARMPQRGSRKRCPKTVAASWINLGWHRGRVRALGKAAGGVERDLSETSNSRSHLRRGTCSEP